MIIREFVPNDLKRVCEIEKMSFDESYELNMFKQVRYWCRFFSS